MQLVHLCLPYTALVAIFLINLASWLSKRRQLQRAVFLKSVLLQDIAALKREAAKLNTPSTYAKCAKLQRQANLKEKELAALGSGFEDVKQDQLAYLFNAVKVLGVALVGISMWGRAFAQLPPTLAFPFNRMLAVPHGKDFSSYGLVAAVPWLLLCNRACNMVVQTIFPPKRFPLPPMAQLHASDSTAEADSTDKKDL